MVNKLCVNQSVATIEAQHYIVPEVVEQNHVSQVDDVISISVNLVTIVVQILNRGVKERSEGQTQNPVNDGCSRVGCPSVRNYRAIPFIDNGAIGTNGRGQGATPTPRVVGIVVVIVIVVVMVVVVKVVTITSITVRLAVTVMIAMSTRPVAVGAIISVVVIAYVSVTTRLATVVTILSILVIVHVTVATRLAAMANSVLAATSALSGCADAVAGCCSTASVIADHFAVVAAGVSGAH